MSLVDNVSLAIEIEIYFESILLLKDQQILFEFLLISDYNCSNKSSMCRVCFIETVRLDLDEYTYQHLVDLIVKREGKTQVER